MNIKLLYIQFKLQLSGVYPSEEIQSFFNMITEKYLGFSRIEVALHPQKEISAKQEKKIQKILLRLKDHEPIQYILGETEFYGFPFKVNKHTLIPRPETEELVKWIVETSKCDTENLDILDIGTGSGCIAIALAKNLPNSNVSAMDISESALKVAEQNADLNKVAITFFKGDILEMIALPNKYDIIVSNPPYVREKEKEFMHKNILKHEPFLALFVADNDPLLFYKAISLLAKNQLKPDGALFFEINEYLADEMFQLLAQAGFRNIVVKKDIFGKDRMIKCNP